MLLTLQDIRSVNEKNHGIKIIWHITMTNTQSARQDEEEPADKKKNISTLVNVILIVFIIKCNESYGEKINNNLNNSVGILLKPVKTNKRACNYARCIDQPEQNDYNPNITFNNNSIAINKIMNYPFQKYLNTTNVSINLVNGTSYSAKSNSFLQNVKSSTNTFSQESLLIGRLSNVHLFKNKENFVGGNIDKSKGKKVMTHLKKTLMKIDLNEPSTFPNNYSTNNMARQIKELEESTNDASNTSSINDLLISLIFDKEISKDINESDSVLITNINNSDKDGLLTNYTDYEWNRKPNKTNTNLKKVGVRTKDSSKIDIKARNTETLEPMKRLKRVHRFKREDLSSNIRKIYKPAQILPGKNDINNTLQNKINYDNKTTSLQSSLPSIKNKIVKEIKDVAKSIQKNKLMGTTGEADLIDQLKNYVTTYKESVRTVNKLRTNHGKSLLNNTFDDIANELAKKTWLIKQRQNDTSLTQKGLTNKQNRGAAVYQWQRGTAKRSLINKPLRGVTLKIKRQRDDSMVDVERNNMLINKRKRTTTLKNRNLKYTSFNKGSDGLNIKTIQIKISENNQRQPSKETTKGDDKVYRIDNINEIFSLRTEITKLIQSPTTTYNERINDRLDLSHNQSKPLDFKLNSLSNDHQTNHFNHWSVGSASPDHIMTEISNNEDLMQPKFQNIRDELNTKNLPGYYDVNNSSTNASIRNMIFASSDVLQKNKNTYTPKTFSAKNLNRQGKHLKNSKHHNDLEPSLAIARKYGKKIKAHKKVHATKCKRGSVPNGIKRLKNKKNQATEYDKSYRSLITSKKVKSYKQTTANVKESGENGEEPKGSKTKNKEKNIKNVLDGSLKNTDSLSGYTPNISEKSLNLINRTAELQYRQRDQYAAADTIGGVFNSYNNNWNNDNNYYYYASSAITDRNNVNNLIVINFDTTPEPTVPTVATTLMEDEEPEVTCPSAVRPTVTFLKRTGFMDYNVVVAALFIGSLMLLFLCCCCCAPIIMIRRKRCESS